MYSVFDITGFAINGVAECTLCAATEAFDTVVFRVNGTVDIEAAIDNHLVDWCAWGEGFHCPACREQFLTDIE